MDILGRQNCLHCRLISLMPDPNETPEKGKNKTESTHKKLQENDIFVHFPLSLIQHAL